MEARVNDAWQNERRIEHPSTLPLPALGASSGEDRVELGAKAESLSRLRRQGLPVPAGFAVPVDLYRRAIWNGEVLQALQALGEALAGDHPPTPETLRFDDPALARAAAALQPQVEASLAAWGREDSPWLALAVRSSATGEDGEQYSFAGVLESYLAVAPTHVPAAILLCWAAAHTRRFLAYCQSHQIDPETIHVGVVIQKLVAARAAGVLHTADPVTGAPDLIIDAVWGLGEVVTAGDITPDEYRRREARATAPGKRWVWHDGWEVQRGQQSRQELLAVAGLKPVELLQEERDRPVLTARECNALARLARRVEQLMGAAQDIEWAIDERRVWLLQARPITTLAAPRRVWTRANLREVYPELPSPMTASLIERYERNWLVEWLAAYGFHLERLGPGMRIIRGRPYSNETLMEAVTGAAGVGAAPIQQGLGDARAAVPRVGDSTASIARSLPLSRFRTFRVFAAKNAPAFRSLAAKLIAVAPSLIPLTRLVLGLCSVQRRVPWAIAGAARQAEQLKRAPLTELDDAALLDGIVGAYRSLQPLDAATCDVMGAIEVCSMLTRWLVKGLVADPEQFLAETTVPGEENITAREVHDFDSLIALGRVEPDRSWLLEHEHPSHADLQELRDTPFGQALAAFLEHYGERGIHESDSAVPRFAEDPAPLLRSIRAAALASAPPAPNDAREPDAWSAHYQGLTGWQRSFPLRAGAVRRLIGRWRWLSALREEVRRAMVGLIGGRRRWELALGARWAERGWLAAPEEYHWLRIEEVERAVAAPDSLPPGWLRDRVERHRAEHKAWAAIPMPNEWIENASPESGSSRTSLLRAEEPERADGVEEFHGLPLSSGVVESEVIVLAGPEELDRVQPGRILVLPVIGPSWLPLFPAARGLVVEMGGVLSHGAILAREYHLPAVANLPGITQWLRTGDRVRLDGTRGIVHRLTATASPEPELSAMAAGENGRERTSHGRNGRRSSESPGAHRQQPESGASRPVPRRAEVQP
jgi:rifampicin phosphotransferase